ncbi:MAG: ABC transporter permease [Phycisphaerae bacterium]|jgi:peptide/nickel transport system permease protein
MGAYIVRRILITLVMLLAASVLGFGVMKLTPGNYFQRLLQDPRINRTYVEQEIAKRGLNKPVTQQYGLWLWRLGHGDMGTSFIHNQPVAKVIGSRLINTLVMNLAAITVTWVLAIPLGIYAAVHQYRWSDKLLSGLSFVGMSTPGFFLALLLMWIFSGLLGLLPAGGLTGVDHDRLSVAGKLADYAAHLAIPTVVLSVGALASLQRITRGNMLEVLRQQYIVTARAKGLSERRVIYRHALRNAINPLITIFGYEFAGLFSGAALMEIILNYPGMGMLMYDSIQAKDEPMVMAGFLMGAMMLLLGNLLADVLLAVVDPRISYR